MTTSDVQDEFLAAGDTPVGGSIDPTLPFKSNPDIQDEFLAAGDVPVGETGIGEIAGAVGKGMVGGAVRAVGVLPGAVGGAVIGGAIAGPPGAIVGGLGGAAYGMWAGDTAADGLGLKRPEEMDPSLRKWGFAGESFGGSAAGLLSPYAIAHTPLRLGTSQAGVFLNKMLDSIKAAPARFAAVEAAMASSAAGGALLAEASAPGNVGIRTNAEFFMGMLNPARLVRSAGEFAIGTTAKVYQAMRPEGRLTAAAKLIRHVHDVTGDDLTATYNAYKAAGLEGLTKENINIAQKTGAKGMTALVSHLEEFSKQFGRENAEKVTQGLDVIRGHISLLTLTGDPAALNEASRLRNMYYTTLIQTRIDKGVADAAAAMSKITSDTPRTRIQLSTTVKTHLDSAIVDARKAESELWKKWIAAEGDGPSGYKNLERQFREEYELVPKEYRPEIVPGPIAEFLKRVKTQGKPVTTTTYDPVTMTLKDTVSEAPGTTVGEMYKFRSIFLDKARSLAIAGDHTGARAYNNMAEAVLDDLDASMTDAGKAAYNEARGFTREFHDAFTRSFVGKLEATGKYGDRIAPELTLHKALATGDDAGFVQLAEIEHATRFLLSRGLQDEGSVNVVMDAQERFVRLAAAKAIDPETHQVNTKTLSKFMHDNELLMDRLPGVREDLTLAIKTTREAKRLELLAKGQNRMMEDMKVFSKIVGAGDSGGVVVSQRALLSNNSEKDIEALITSVTKGTVGKDGKPLFDVPAATAGLRASIYTAAVNLSTGKNRGELNPDQVMSLLFTPPPGQRSVMKIMEDSGVVSAREAGKIKQVFEALKSINRSTKPTTAIEIKADLTDAGIAVLSRVAGSGLLSTVSQASPIGSGHGLIVASAGARLGEYLFTKLSLQTARQMLIDAISDPSSGKLDLIMQRASTMTPKQIVKQATQLNAYRVQSMIGITGNIAENPDPFTGSW
jgi:hypothetical protein